MFALSYASRAGVAAYAERLAGWLEAHPGTSLASVARTLAVGRSHLRCRAAVVAAGRAELVAALRALAAGEEAAGAVAEGTVGEGAARGAVWVFSGHGSQWAGMGAELLHNSPAFARVIDRLEPVFRDEAAFSVRRAIEDGDVADVGRAQALVFAVQAGLAGLWRAHGHRPSAVIGHSVGEIAAAVAAGALSLEDGARLSCRRSALLRQAAGRGAMAMVGLAFDETAARLAGQDAVSAAIASSPASTVVSGDAEAVAGLVRAWSAEGIAVRPVNSDVAFHSPHMDPLTGPPARRLPRPGLAGAADPPLQHRT
ncbi:hypothetical protein GCM10020000_84770 [Streptomyces olivoverticillatus]